ncbi:hypothetical protein HOY80DRAFT_1029038 [Tuber brumale]|nr:hypothetical protein HOY80DRAFT_1029038 [Tuber brumale]
MFARNKTNINSFRNKDVCEIFHGMKRLHLAWDALVRVAVNDVPSRMPNKEAIIALIKNCGKKLNNSLLIILVLQLVPDTPAIVIADLLVEENMRLLGTSA